MTDMMGLGRWQSDFDVDDNTCFHLRPSLSIYRESPLARENDSISASSAYRSLLRYRYLFRVYSIRDVVKDTQRFLLRELRSRDHPVQQAR